MIVNYVSTILRMKLLVHPDIKDITLEGIFYALGDRQRLRIVKNLYAAGGKPLSCTAAVKGIVGMPVSTRSNNFRILREAGLVRSEKDGRLSRNYLRLDEINKRFPDVLKTIIKHIK